MARHDMNTMMTTGEMVAALAIQPFQAIFNALGRAATRTSRMTALTQLNAMTDEDLAKRGVSRAEAAQLILRAQF